MTRLDEIKSRLAAVNSGITHEAGCDGRIGSREHCSICGFRKAAPSDIAYLLAEVERLERQRDGWMESAAQFSRNSDFYRGLVAGIGAQFGEVAYISDDGSKQQDVLCLKVPELVAAELAKLKELEGR